MKLSLFDYDLPKHLIAQHPSRRRDQSRLMVLDRAAGETRHGRFADLLDYLRPGDALVVNNTRVFKARLLGKRATGGQVEIFLVRQAPYLSSRGTDPVGAVAISGLPRSDVSPGGEPSPLAMTGMDVSPGGEPSPLAMTGMEVSPGGEPSLLAMTGMEVSPGGEPSPLAMTGMEVPPGGEPSPLAMTGMEVPPGGEPSPLAMTASRATPKSAEIWEALVQPSKRLSEGERIAFDPGESVELASYLGEGRWRVAFNSTSARQRIVARHGHVPLPQYISRDDSPTDIRRYQTVFASAAQTGAVAAPTAGFHLTRGLLRKIREKKVSVCEVTLHVGPGTFKPITVDDIEQHMVDPEYAILPPPVADTLNRTRRTGGRIFAVGTTSVRTLESAPLDGDLILPFEGMVDLYIRSGHQFRSVDHLVTNFHLPKSSLLVLVAAFAGRERVLEAYAEAVAREYRFYSYGDAMLIL